MLIEYRYTEMSVKINKISWIFNYKKMHIYLKITFIA